MAPDLVALAELALATFDAWSPPHDVSELEHATLALRIAELAARVRAASWRERARAVWAQRDAFSADCTYLSSLAETWSKLVTYAERDGDTELARLLRTEVVALLRADDSTRLAGLKYGARAAVVCDDATRAWFRTISDDARLAADFVQLAAWREAGDVRWEALFDALEIELESAPKERRELAAEALLEAGLPRAAARHALRGDSRPNFALLAALWRDELLREYASGVEKHRAWGRSIGVDWGDCETFAKLAAAQHRWGDVEGAARSAAEAYDIAARGEAMYAGDVSAAGGLPTEVAAWFLAHLVPMEVARGNESEARALYARCLAFLDTPAVGAKRASARVTTWGAVGQACAESGWVDDAIALASRHPVQGRDFVFPDAAIAARTVADVVRCIERIERPEKKLYALLSRLERGAALSRT